MHNHVFQKEILYSIFTKHYPLVYFSLSEILIVSFGRWAHEWQAHRPPLGPPWESCKLGPPALDDEYHAVFVCIIMQYFQVPLDIRKLVSFDIIWNTI